ncbi:MAG: class I SAM-dependent methyltransferase [Bacteroidota bacterium]
MQHRFATVPSYIRSKNKMAPISTLLGNTDIYLLDQIMKGRYALSDIILDAGAGGGRNLHWFAQEGFQIFATDRNPEAIEMLRYNYPDFPADRFQVAPVEKLPFPDAFFNHVISSAVLHFAEDATHFEQMFAEMLRVLKPDGSLFIRTATDVGLADKMIPLGNGRFTMPDGSDRFLLTRTALDNLVAQYKLQFLEPFKTVLVDELRSMSVVIVSKTA